MPCHLRKKPLNLNRSRWRRTLNVVRAFTSTRSPRTPSTAHTLATRRLSLQFTPISPVFTAHGLSLVEDDETIEEEKAVLKWSASKATMRRRAMDTRPRARWDDSRLAPLTTVMVEKPQETNVSPETQQSFGASYEMWIPRYPTSLQCCSASAYAFSAAR